MGLIIKNQQRKWEPPQRESKVKRVLPDQELHSPILQYGLDVYKPVDLPVVQQQLQQIMDELVLKNQLPHKPKIFISSHLRNNAHVFGAATEKPIFLDIGCLKFAKNPEEVVQILGHELSHIVHQDHKFFYSRLLFPVFSAAFAAIGVGYAYHRYLQKRQSKSFVPFESLAGILAGAAAFIGAVNVNSILNMRKETRADRDAIRYAQKAGFATKIPSEELYLLIKGREGIPFTDKQRRYRFLCGPKTHPDDKPRRTVLERFMREHPDPKDVRDVMPHHEWQALQAKIAPVYELLEFERSLRVLDHYVLDPKLIFKFLK